MRALVLSLVLASPALASAQGFTLDQYRAAETANDGFVVTRPRGLGHLGVSATLHLEYALEPLRGTGATGARIPLVDHQLVGQLGGAIGLFDRFVIALRAPIVMVMSGPGGDPLVAPAMRSPIASGAGLGDVALSLRAVLVDETLFGLAIQTEATVPLAEGIAASQDLAGEAGVSFTPEIAGELRFAPVRITANLGGRFRQASVYANQALLIQSELTWALGVGVDIIEEVLDATLEGFGATPFRRFANQTVSPVELLLGVRVRPVLPLYLGLAGGVGLGDAYGAPIFRGVLTVGYRDPGVTTPSAPEPEPLPEPEPEPEPVLQEPEQDTGPPLPEEMAVEPPPPSELHVAPPDAADYGQLDRDGDRIVDAEDHCILDREDYDEIQDSDGCPEENADADPVLDVDDVCPLTPGVATADAATNGCPELAYIGERGAIVILQRVEFATGSDRILPESEPVLAAVLQILTHEADVTRVRVEGHTDDRGSDRSNIRLSRARAASVRRWLTEHGLSPERLEAWGCGEAHPLASGRGAAARQTNRRVEFFVVEPMSPDLALRERCVEAP
jgi:outer membrane protein OmpA-like peptidoglycan-associated protein